jgi:hypothetical protein
MFFHSNVHLGMAYSVTTKQVGSSACGCSWHDFGIDDYRGSEKIACTSPHVVS